jgi:hypothetical protein
MFDINKYKFFVRNFSLTDEELATLANVVLMDISKTTKIFKYMMGFSIVKDLYEYDFELISRMNDRVRSDLTSIHVGEVSDEEILRYLSDFENEEFPSPDLTYEQDVYPADRTLIEVVDVVALRGNRYESIFNKFEHLFRFKYRMKDQEGIEFDESGKEQVLAIVTTTIEIDRITDDIVRRIEPAFVEGLKYFAQSSYTGVDDMQSTAILLKRYEIEKERLMNMFPLVDAKYHREAWL